MCSAGEDTSCLPATDTSSLASVHANGTDTLETCKPLGMLIEGGQKPYTVVLSAANSLTIANYTMKPEDDVFTYINRENPDGELIGEYSHNAMMCTSY